MIDYFKSYGKGELNTPNFSHAFSITPSNTVDFAYATKAIYVGGAGAISIVTINGETVIFSAVPVGTILPIRAKRINVAGTSATNLVGLY